VVQSPPAMCSEREKRALTDLMADLDDEAAVIARNRQFRPRFEQSTVPMSPKNRCQPTPSRPIPLR
jgi:hypothetical protein